MHWSVRRQSPASVVMAQLAVGANIVPNRLDVGLHPVAADLQDRLRHGGQLLHQGAGALFLFVASTVYIPIDADLADFRPQQQLEIPLIWVNHPPPPLCSVDLLSNRNLARRLPFGRRGGE